MLNHKAIRRSPDHFIVEGEKFISEIPEKYNIVQFYMTKKFSVTADVGVKICITV